MLFNRLLPFTFVLLLTSSLAEAFEICLENQQAAPFVFGTGDVKEGQHGIAPDIFFLTAKATDTPINFVRLPWKRCIADLKQGNTDAIAAFIYSEERDKWAVFPKANGTLDDRYFYQSDYLVFTYPGSNLSWDGELLLPKSANVQSIPGYVSTQRLSEMGFNSNAPLQPKKAIELISRKLLDGFVVDALVGKRLIADLELEGLVVPLEKPFMTQHWYIAFSKQAYAQQAADIEAFWTALKAVRINHSDALFDQYL